MGDVKYVQFANVQTGEGKTELAVFLSLTLPTYLDPSKIRIGKKREVVEVQLERVRPSTSQQTVFLLRQENASKEQLICCLNSKLDFHENVMAAIPTSVRTLRRENLQLQEENDYLADIVLQKDHRIKKINDALQSQKQRRRAAQRQHFGAPK